MFHSDVCPAFSLVLDPRGTVVGLGGEVGSACEYLRTMKVVYWFNVSEFWYRLTWPGLSQAVKW